MPRKFKRVVIIADLHCGHIVGLTHPDFNPAYPRNSEKYALTKLRHRLWKQYASTIDELKPIDVLLVNGDVVDGKGKKSGGTELLTSSRDEQCDMAAAAIGYAEAELVEMSYGTPYHVGMSEDWENVVAAHKKVQAIKISDHACLSVNGCIIDYRHFVSSSIIPHGRFTAVARERLWNVLKAERAECPKADIIVRSHVHYYGGCFNYNWEAITTPALQGPKTKYGKRKMSGTVDFGLVWYDIESKGTWHRGARIVNLKSPKQAMTVV